MRTEGSVGKIRVPITLTNVSATEGEDYLVPSPAEIVFEDGELIKSIDIHLRDDMVSLCKFFNQNVSKD